MHDSIYNVADNYSLAPLETSEVKKVDDEKQQLLEQFETIIEKVSINDFEVEDDVDLFSIFKELTELKNEVKKESRQFKSAFSEFKSIFTLLSDDNALLKEEILCKNMLLAKQEIRSKKTYALSLIEYKDYLLLSLNSMVKKNKPHWLDKIMRRKNALDSFIEGQQMLISRFDNLLASLKVVPLITVNKNFDATLMQAVDTRTDQNKQQGIVLEEQRVGYLFNNEVLRLAQVIVNKLEN